MMDIVNTVYQQGADFLKPGTTILAAWLRTLPARELSTELASKDVNESTWYTSPEEHAERMIITCLFIPICAMLFNYACGTTIKDSFRIHKSQRHPLLGAIFVGILIALPSFKYHKRGFNEVAFMFNPCHFATACFALWSFFPCQFFLHLLAAFRINSIIATLTPDFGNASFIEIILYWVQHLFLDFFPTYAIARGYFIPTNSMTWGVLVLLMVITFYFTAAIILGLLMDRNINFVLSPPRVILSIFNPEWGISYQTAVVIFHFFSLVGGHAFGRVETLLVRLLTADSSIKKKK